MHFGNPTMFWLLALVPALIGFLVWAFRARRRALERFAAQPLADKLAASVSRVARRWKAVLLVGTVLFAVAALTQPRWGFEWREVKHKGVDIFVLLDVSKSMLTEDVRPNRLEQAKFAVHDLVHKLGGDRVGLIAFSGTAFVQCPLTVDYEAFKLTLNDASPRVIPRGGSAIGMAIQTALKAFEAGEGRDRAIVLITDGEDTEGDPIAAAEEAAKQSIRVFAVGVGSTEGELIPVKEEGKPLEFVKDREGKVVKSRLNEATLRKIALTTQGIYARSAAGDFGLDEIYDKGIHQLRREEHEARLQKKYFERFQWPLGVAVVLVVIELFVTDRRRIEWGNGRMGEWGKRNAHRSTLNAPHSAAAVAAALLVWVVGSANADKASELYEQGKYQEAFELFKKAAEKSEKENWPLLYDLGVAAYRAGKADEAAKAFERALGSPDSTLQQKSHYNLGNLQYRIGQQLESQGPSKALPAYEGALGSYDQSLAIDPKDEDAKHNGDLTQKKIEELKKKMEEEKQQQGQGKSEGKGDEGKGQQGQQQKQEDQPQQKPQPPQPQQPPKPEPDQKPQPGQNSGQAESFDQMQAAMLLDNLRDEERNWNFFPELQMSLKDAGEPEKDW